MTGSAFLTRHGLAGQHLSPEQASAAADRITDLEALGADGLIACGYRYLTVVHDATDNTATPRYWFGWADAHPGAVASATGSHEATIWLLAPPTLRITWRHWKRSPWSTTPAGGRCGAPLTDHRGHRPARHHFHYLPPAGCAVFGRWCRGPGRSPQPG